MMAGIETITRRIAESAHSEAQELLEQARVDAAAQLQQAEQQAALLCDQVLARAQEQAQQIKRAAESDVERDEKQQLLQAKNRVIDRVFDLSVQRLRQLDDDRYFTVLKDLILQYARPAAGELVLSASDRKRMPSGFMHLIDAALGESRKLQLREQPDETIDGGFVLRYGNVDINCSFAALLAQRREELTQQVYRLLFG